MTCRRLAGASLAILTLGGCAHYAPAPLTPDQTLAALEGRRLDEKPSGAVWSGADLLAAALARNPRVTEARAKYRTALAAARVARLTPGLTLTLTTEYADESPRWGYGAAIDAPLDLGARRSDRITAADLKALQAFYDLGDAAWTARTALEKARADLALADQETALAAQALDLRRERQSRLQARVAAGQDARPALLLAQGERAAAEHRVLAAQGRRDQAVLALAHALGVPPAEAQALRIAPPPAPPRLDGLPAWRRDAALGRGDVLKAVADYDLSESALRLEVAKQYPEVRIGPGYTYDHGVNKLPFNLNLALPTLDLNRRAIARAEAARAAAGRTLEATQADVLAAVDSAAAALASARDDLGRNEAQDLPAARRLALNTARSAVLGETDRAEDLAARAGAVDAELALIDARRAVAGATVEVEDALRHAFDPAEAAILRAALAEPAATSPIVSQATSRAAP